MAAERQLANMEATATAAGDAAAFENGVLRRQVADLRKAAHAERQVAPPMDNALMFRHADVWHAMN